VDNIIKYPYFFRGVREDILFYTGFGYSKSITYDIMLIIKILIFL